jgi:V/A-type H+-transporting ATPase subunit F
MRKGKIVILGDRYAVNAFGILGVEGFVVENADDAEKRLKTLSRSGDIALIIVTKDVADMVQDVIDSISMSPGAPVITVIPSMWSDVKPVDAAALLKKALGVG